MFLQSLQSGKFVEYAFRKDLDFVSFKVPNRFTFISIQRRKERGCALAMLKCALQDAIDLQDETIISTATAIPFANGALKLLLFVPP